MENLTRIIKEKGQRFTSKKKDVLFVLQQKPQTVLEILRAVEQRNKIIDKVTIYRILASFVKIGIVKEINFGDKEARYELITGNHHHHLVCESCGGIEDVGLSEEIFLEDIQKLSSFKIKRHSLEFFGTCKKCQ